MLTIKDVNFEWQAGQHVYLSIPRLGLIESHPYTIATARTIRGTCCCSSIQLVIRAHGGFSKRVHDFANRPGEPDRTLTGFVTGPLGAPPKVNIYETLVLVGASTGASFIVPLLESVATGKEIVQQYYGQAQKTSYYMGCSTGNAVHRAVDGC